MKRRIGWVGLLTGVLVLLFAGPALAVDRVLDETTCEDTSPWGNGSVIPSGDWIEATKTCDNFSYYLFIEPGDKLTIPSGVTLQVGNLVVEGTLIANGDIESNFAVGTGGGAVEINGELSFSAGSRGGVSVASGATMKVTGSLNAHGLSVHGTGSVLDNFGSVTVTQGTHSSANGLVWIHTGGVFNNHCGATLSYRFIQQDSVITEVPCSSSTTVAPSTTEAPSTTVAPSTTAAPSTTESPVTTVPVATTAAPAPTAPPPTPPPTTAAPAPTAAPDTTATPTTVEVAGVSISSTLPFTGVENGLGYFALLLTVGGIAVLIATAVEGRRRED